MHIVSHHFLFINNKVFSVIIFLYSKFVPTILKINSIINGEGGSTGVDRYTPNIYT